MLSAVAALTVLSMVAYGAVAVLLWRIATRAAVGPGVRYAIRFTAGLLLFVLVMLWSGVATSGS